jgi:hypothetical protein
MIITEAQSRGITRIAVIGNEQDQLLQERITHHGSGERETFRHRLTQLVKTTGVEKGELLTPYDFLSSEWVPFEQFPEQLEGVVRAARSILQPQFRFEPEAFHLSSLDPILQLQVVMHAKGSPPMTSPWTGKAGIDLKKVAYPDLSQYIDKVKTQYYRVQPRGPIYLFNFPMARAVPRFAEKIAEDDIPEFNFIMFKSFPLYRRDNLVDAVAEDASRFILEPIGIPDALRVWAHDYVRTVQQAKVGESWEFDMPTSKKNIPPPGTGRRVDDKLQTYTDGVEMLYSAELMINEGLATEEEIAEELGIKSLDELRQLLLRLQEHL